MSIECSHTLDASWWQIRRKVVVIEFAAAIHLPTLLVAKEASRWRLNIILIAAWCKQIVDVCRTMFRNTPFTFETAWGIFSSSGRCRRLLDKALSISRCLRQKRSPLEPSMSSAPPFSWMWVKLWLSRVNATSMPENGDSNLETPLPDNASASDMPVSSSPCSKAASELGKLVQISLVSIFSIEKGRTYFAFTNHHGPAAAYTGHTIAIISRPECATPLF